MEKIQPSPRPTLHLPKTKQQQKNQASGWAADQNLLAQLIALSKGSKIMSVK